MYRFALRPAWLLSHVLVVLLIFVLINLGMWQLRRLDDRRDRNDEIAARLDIDEVAVAAVLTPGVDPEELRFRSVTAVGTYVPDADVLIDNRSLDGLPGAWVVTPLNLDDGAIVLVNRGFAGVGDDGFVVAPPPPQGDVEVHGNLVEFADRNCRIRQTTGSEQADGAERNGQTGAQCLSEVTLETVLGVDVLPMVVQRAGSTPADDAFLSPVPLPESGDGPHFSYAMQWFIFTTVAVVGYPLILRKNAIERANADRPAAADDELDLELRRLLEDEGRADTAG